MAQVDLRRFNKDTYPRHKPSTWVRATQFQYRLRNEGVENKSAEKEVVVN